MVLTAPWLLKCLIVILLIGLVLGFASEVQSQFLEHALIYG